MTFSQTSSEVRFRPRSGRIRIGGLPWLARMIDKGRASLSGTLGEYSFPCAMDWDLLKFLGMDEKNFQDLLRLFPKEEELLSALGIASRNLNERSIWADVFLVRFARLLDELEREEGS
ncbi:MAG: DUF5069 domain-containing protein [Leptospirales bacterium]